MNWMETLGRMALCFSFDAPLQVAASALEKVPAARRRLHRDITEASTLPMQRLPVVYELQRWPDLEGVPRSASLYQALSVMSTRAVTPAWLGRQLQWPESRAESFLEMLERRGEARRRLPGPRNR